MNEDEYNVDFEDTGAFAKLRWDEIFETVLKGISSPADQRFICRSLDFNAATSDIQRKAMNRTYDSSIRRLIMKIQPVPRSLNNLTSSFSQAIHPRTIDLNIVWGLLLLNINLSVASVEKLSRTADWLVKLRRVTERYYRCFELCEEQNDQQEATLTIVDIFEHTLLIMCESAKFLRRSPNEEDSARAWLLLDNKIMTHLKDLDEVTRHLGEITSYSRANMTQQAKNISIRHALEPESDEYATFPLSMLPYQPNEKFFGRQSEIEKLDEYLAPRSLTSLRTFTIYGRRGVGKTEIALEYAYRNPSHFDAIFWIGCETSLTLRSSFTNAARILLLPGADGPGRDEENQLAVQTWLKKTKKTWLLVFDNAEKNSESILKGYWPVGANGAILITSRTYHNFLKDTNRKGETVKLFNLDESWELLLRLLGNKWMDAYANGLLRQADEVAARAWLRKVGGLPLSIKTLAGLITGPKPVPGRGIVEVYSRFEERERLLPPRHRGERSEAIRALDALFDMTFSSLSTPARDLLSVVALISPDEILIELFLPRKQDALNGKLAFAKQEHVAYTNLNEATIASIISIPPELLKVLEELKKADVIRWDRRIIAVHRVVQEAMNYHSKGDLQESFNSAVHLVHEAFPKQEDGGTLFDQWPVCANYITHAVQLANRFAEYQVQEALKSSDEFLELMANATWYLYEVGDYDLSRKVVTIGKNASEDKRSYLYSHLCNTQACTYYELNRMSDCRRNIDMALKIREEVIKDPNSNQIAIALHNKGNLECDVGHYDEALTYLNRAVTIRTMIGDSAAFQLGQAYLGVGRCYVGKKEYHVARQYFSRAEQLFIRTGATSVLFLAHVYYAYGNLELVEKQYPNARRSFTECWNIASAKTPIHPLTAAAYYSLGCVEFVLGNDDHAKRNLNKARTIAELRSPTRDDGTVARVLWKLAQVLRSDISGADSKEAQQLLDRAYIARDALIASGEASERLLRGGQDDDGRTDLDLEEDSFDLLVPGFFR